MATVKLGDKVKDRITGFTGIATGRHEYLTGCTRITIEPQELKDGKPVASEWFDVQRVEVLKAGAVKLDNGITPGGPADMPRQAMPRR
jgi:hypothetical protein